MGLFRVSVSELKSKAGTLREYNQQFKARVSDLETEEQRVTGMWEGQARDTFHAAFEKDKGQMTNFYNLIEQYCQALEAIAEKYAAVENQNTATAQQRNY